MDRDLRIRMLFAATDKVTGPLRAIVGGSRAASAALKGTRDQLKAVQGAQADIASFRTLKAGLADLDTRGQKAQARVAALARQIAAADTPTKKLTAEFEKAKREAAQLGEQHRIEGERLQALRTKLGAAGVATGSLVSHERRLRTEAAALNRELSEQEKRLQMVDSRADRFARARGRFGRMQGVSTGLATGGVASIGTGIGMLAPLKGAGDAAIAFQSTITDIAQKQAMTAAEADKLRRTLILVSKETAQLPSTLATGVDTLVGMGMGPTAAAKMIGPIAKAATAYKADMDDLAKAGFAATDNLKIAAEDGSKLLGILATAGKEGAVELKDMAQYLPSLTAGYQALGQRGLRSAADIAAGLEVVKTGTGDAASAATNLENLLQKISSPATNKAFAKLGVDLPAALKKAYADGKTPIEAITELTNKTLKGDLSRLGYLFEDAQVQGALRPLIQNLDKFRDIREKAMAGQGAVDADFVQRQNDDPAAKEAKLAAARERLALVTGTILTPALTALYDAGSKVADVFGDWANKHPRLAKALLLSVGVIGGLLVVSGGLAIGIAGLIAPFAALSAVAGFFNLAMLPTLGIVLGVVAAIGALVAVGYLIYTQWGAIAAFFSRAWSMMKAEVGNGIAGIARLIVDFSPLGLFYAGFAAVLSWFGVDLPARFTGFGAMILNGLISGITGKLTEVKNMIVGAGQKLAGWFKSALGIHSPSRVFMGFGGYLMDGLAAGIDQRRAEPVRRMNGVSAQLAAALATGMSAPAVATTPAALQSAAASAGGIGGGGGITIHIHVGDQERGQDIAARVRTELQRIDRERAAQGRSNFGDRADGEDA